MSPPNKRASTAMRTTKGRTSVRRPGRPSKTALFRGTKQAVLSSELIIETAFELCRKLPLAELSIVRLARKLYVTPASLHYYLDGREVLLAGVISRYWQMLLPCFDQEPLDRWEFHLATVARSLYRKQVRYSGITSYFISHNKFRLIQSKAPSGDDYGVRYLERVLHLFRSQNFSVKESVVNAHHLANFISTSAHAASWRQLPSQHHDYISAHLKRMSPDKFPCVHEALLEFTSLSPDEAFETGLKILIHGFINDANT